MSKEGAAAEKQDATAGGSKPNVKVKSIDLPIVANNIWQLDGDVLTNFVEYEVRDAAIKKLSRDFCAKYEEYEEGAKGEHIKLFSASENFNCVKEESASIHRM